MGGVRNILLTGATGYLGSNLAKALLKQGYEVSVLVRRTSNMERISHLLFRVKVYTLGESRLQDIFTENKIDCVIHAATCYGRKGESLADIYNTNILFPLELLQECVKCEVPYFINTDTSLPPNLSNYSLSKKQFLDILKLNSFAIKIVNVELQYIYGPGDDHSKFITFIISKFLQNDKTLSLTSCEQIRDFVYIKDVICGFFKILDNISEMSSGISISLGSGEAKSLRDVVLMAKNLSGNSETTIKFGDLQMRNDEIMYSVADLRYLESLGWKAQFSLELGLTETIRKDKYKLHVNHKQ